MKALGEITELLIKKVLWKVFLFIISVIIVISLADDYFSTATERCERVHTNLNVSTREISMFHGYRASTCFVEPQWSEYCKSIYPDDCPNKEGEKEGG